MTNLKTWQLILGIIVSLATLGGSAKAYVDLIVDSKIGRLEQKLKDIADDVKIIKIHELNHS